VPRHIALNLDGQYANGFNRELSISVAEQFNGKRMEYDIRGDSVPICATGIKPDGILPSGGLVTPLCLCGE
jgi:hypothetical protein